MSDSVERKPINVDVNCQLSEIEIESFKQLFSGCYQRVFPNGSVSLSRVTIVEDDAIEKVVNKLIAETGVDGYYKRKCSSAVTVPLDYQGTFFTVIIFGKNEVPNNPEEFSFSNISTFLEELLHVKLYEETQENKELCPKDSVKVLARMTIDEYIVNRRKYGVITEIFGPLGYDEKLIPKFDGLDDKLFHIITSAATKIITIDEACNTLLNITYREFLEPLTRHFSGYDCIENITEIEIEKYPFLNDIAYKFWERIHIELKTCFNNVENIDKYANSITAIIADFFEEIGVTYNETQEGFYYYFDNSALLRYKRFGF